MKSLDIERIDVLRDGATAAMYGVRGVRGAILVKNQARTLSLATDLEAEHRQVREGANRLPCLQRGPDSDPTGMPEHHRRKRIAKLLALGILLELGLFELAKLAPALARIARTGMFVVVGGLVVAIIHAMRSRTGNDRRQSDRRHEVEPKGEG